MVVVRRCGFTLIELLAVIGIIALLISLLLPVLSRARQQAQWIACQSNLHQIGLAVEMYENQYGGYLPQTFWATDDLAGEKGSWYPPPDPVGYPVWDTLLVQLKLMPKSLMLGCPTSRDVMKVHSYAFNTTVSWARQWDITGMPPSYTGGSPYYFNRVKWSRIKRSTDAVVCQDGQTTLGNGGTQENGVFVWWDSSYVFGTRRAIGHPQGKSDGLTRINTLFIDGHVGSPTRTQLWQNWNYYSGNVTEIY